MTITGPRKQVPRLEDLRDLNKWELALLTILDFIILGLMIYTIFRVVIASEENTRGIAIVFLSLESVVFICLTLLLVIYLIAKTRQKRKWKKQFREIQEGEEGQQYINKEEVMRYQEVIEENRLREERRKIEIVEQKKKEKNLERFVFKGDIKGKICKICKLDLRKKQKVVACPQCQSLFHKEHLEEWLEKSQNCPVCSEKLPIE